MDMSATCRSGVLWHILAGVWRMPVLLSSPATFPAVGIGLLGVAFAFGLTVADDGLCCRTYLRRAFQSCGEPSASGLPARCANKHVIPYIIAQGPLERSSRHNVLWTVASGKAGLGAWRICWPMDTATSAPASTALGACVLMEFVMTFLLPAHHCGNDLEGCGPAALPGFRSELALTLIHLVSIPVTNTSVNPAGAAPGLRLFAGWRTMSANSGCSGSCHWLGAAVAGWFSRWMYDPEPLIDTVVIEERSTV